ncbi:Endothelin-converting enzyme 1 [Schistosoma haematobium]|uniref:Endothelin-converting enzyme 1 n=1 Tax=Schistosoma haematobium TaxID=6185 RepID=A0A922LHQ3_SCHHA|nr:Endothelin-converting enzyme 1 [Schistosoma haematobium]KAH9585124.1 Endothelin-converting enzyme 1 [Schistosoma haematobium]
MSTDQRYFTVKTAIQYVMIHLVVICCHVISLSETTSQNVATRLSTTDPCDDFDRYACTEWVRNNPVSNKEQEINTFKKAGITTDHYFYNIIANKSYALDDPHLFTAREFYEACLKGPHDSANHVANQFRQLISMLFGEWDLLTSPSTNMTNADGARNILNLSLTDLYLPLLSTTGHSPLFSLDIDEEDRTIRIYPGQLTSDQNLLEKDGVLDLKIMFYKSVISLNLNMSQNTKLARTFQLFDRLVNAFLDPQTSSTYKKSQTVSMDELKAICPPIDWDYLFDKLFNQTGFRSYHKLPVKVEEKHALQYYCAFHEIQLETDEDKRSLRDSPTYLPEAYYLKNLNRIYIFAGLMQPPFYEKDEDLFTRYNGLGWIIAHELLHAIDLIGVLEDINGNQRSGKDSYAGLIANMRQTDCLRSHYKNHSDSFEKSDRIGTRNEILADNGGLKIMYNTHRKLQNRQRVQNSSEILASDRLFFLRFAQASWSICSLICVQHSRLIGALSNSEEFAKAYHCPIGSPMNPLKKCKLW